MSGPATGAAAPRVLLLDDDRVHDVFEVIDVTDGIVRARSAFLFEVGEEIKVRIEVGGAVSEALARVRAHSGSGADAKITELELSGQVDVRRVVSG